MYKLTQSYQGQFSIYKSEVTNNPFNQTGEGYCLVNSSLNSTIQSWRMRWTRSSSHAASVTWCDQHSSSADRPAYPGPWRRVAGSSPDAGSFVSVAPDCPCSRLTESTSCSESDGSASDPESPCFLCPTDCSRLRLQTLFLDRIRVYSFPHLWICHEVY